MKKYIEKDSLNWLSFLFFNNNTKKVNTKIEII